MTAALSPTPRADEGSAVGAALAALRAVAPQIQATCDGAFPQAGLSILRRTGVLAALASAQPSPHELMTALREVGRANLSLGRLFEGHVNGARLIDWYGTPEQRAQLAADLADGKVFGVWNTEPAPVTLIEEPGAARLQGAKSYATGAGAIDHAIITARTAEGGRQMVIVAADDPRRADLSTWRVSGMRGTVSGTYDLTDLPVTRATRLGQPGQYEREPRFSAGAWRFTAVQLGGAERILILLRDHLASSSAGDDPIQRARFGRALAAVRSAYLWVGEAANRAEAPEADHAAIAFVLMTRGVVEQAGLTVIEAAQRSVGTRAFFEDNPLDGACRDLALYLRQPVPDRALDRAAAAFIPEDLWRDDPLW